MEFKAVSHAVDEDGVKLSRVDPADLVGQLALDKSASVKGELVIGSDLVVALKDKIMGKPKDKKEARQFLKALSGKTHTVYCGVAVAGKNKSKPVWNLLCCYNSQVKFLGNFFYFINILQINVMA